MDVRNTFLNGTIEEEVFVCQQPNFEDIRFLDHIFKLNKILYGLKQAPRTWYDQLKSSLLQNNYVIGKTDPTLFFL